MHPAPSLRGERTAATLRPDSGLPFAQKFPAGLYPHGTSPGTCKQGRLPVPSGTSRPGGGGPQSVAGKPVQEATLCRSLEDVDARPWAQEEVGDAGRSRGFHTREHESALPL